MAGYFCNEHSKWYKTAKSFRAHRQKFHGDHGPVMQPPEVTIPNPAGETVTVANLKEESMAESCVNCQLKDRDIRDLERDRDAAYAQAKAAEERATAAEQSHPNFQAALQHSETCPTCKEARTAHNKHVLEEGIKNLSNQTLSEIVIKRGLIPARIPVRD